MNQTLDIDEQIGLIKAINICSNICFGFMLVLAISPIVGIFIPINNSVEMSHLFYAKTLIVKISGLACLALGVFLLVVKSILYGGKYLFETLFKNPWNILLLVTILWGVISFKEVDPYDLHTAIFGWAYPYEGFVAYVSYAGIYIGASSLRSDKQKRIVLNALLITAAVVAVFTLIGELTGTDFAFFRNGMCFDYSGSFINPNHYAYYICVICILSAVAAMMDNKIYIKILYVASFALNMAILCLNNSFGSYLALLVGMIFFGAWYIRKKHLPYSLSIIGLFIILAFALNYKYITKELTGFFQGIFEFFANLISGKDPAESIGDVTSETANGRAAGWSAAIQAIKDSPIFGYGPDMEYNTLFFKIGHKGSSHNHFLYLAVCFGIP